tara:strand:- start:49096 stop:49737 length:642 start_codon:yes stop_codon:yes gene_type:complete
MFLRVCIIFVISCQAHANFCVNLFDFRPFFDTETIFSTSNTKKQQIISRFLKTKQLQAKFRNEEIDEIHSNSLEVAVHKATSAREKGKLIIIEDTSLHIEGAEIGPLIKWNIHRLPEFIGKKATMEVIMAYYMDGMVYTFHGKLKGHIGKPTTKGDGLDPYFYPEGSELSAGALRQRGEFETLDPRYEALEKLVNKDTDHIRPAIYTWNGPWQ